MKRWISRFFAALIITSLFSGLSLISHADEKTPGQVLTVAFPETKGINEVNEDGTRGGIVYDWLMEVAKYTGWQYEFISGDPSMQLLEMREGKYDLMGGMYRNDYMEGTVLYPDYVMGSNYSLLIYRKDNGEIKNFDLTTLNGKRIGVLAKATEKVRRLNNFLNFNGLTCEIISFQQQDDYDNCLEDGSADIMLGSDTHLKDRYNVAAKFLAEPYYLVTAKDEPELCGKLNAAMTEIYAANPNFAQELYDKYFPDTYINSMSFSQQDLEFIRSAQPVRVAVESQYPLSYEKNGALMGIIPDIFSLIAQRTGLTFSYVSVDTYADAIDAVKSREADISACFMDDEYAAFHLGLALTKPYAWLDEVILRNKNGLSSENTVTLALPDGRTLLTEESRDRLLPLDDYAQCLRAVNSGQADYTRLPAAFLEDLYLKDYYANIVLTSTESAKTPLSIALNEPVNVPLYSVLSKTVNNLSSQEVDNVLTKNLTATGEANITLKSIFYTNPILATTLCVSFLALVMAIILLSNRFAMKNRMMELKLEKSEEMGRAKSDFLSRMSHEIRTPMNAIIGLTNLAQLSGEATPALRDDLEKIHTSADFLLALVNDVLDMSKIECQKMTIQNLPFRLGNLPEQMENIFGLQAKEKGIHLIVRSSENEQLLMGDEMRIKQVLTNLLSNACKFTDCGGTILLEIGSISRDNDSSEILFTVQDNGIGIDKEDIDRIFDSFEQAGILNSSGTGLGLPICSSLVKLMGGQLNVESHPGVGSSFRFTLRLPVFHGTLAAPSVSESEVSLEGKRVLLAEDNDLNAEIAVALLELQSVTADRAANGQRAVDLFRSHPEGYYDLILMDIQMPIKDGLTATTEIRSMPRGDAKRIPILAMTANTFQEDRERALAAGMNAFIPKPFDVELLYKTLKQVIARR